MRPCPSPALNLSIAPYFLLENVKLPSLTFRVFEAPSPAGLILGGAHLAASPTRSISGMTVSACRSPRLSPRCQFYLHRCAACMPSWFLLTHQDSAQGTSPKGFSDPPEDTLCLVETTFIPLGHFTGLEYISAFLFLRHRESLGHRCQVWFIRPILLGDLWVGMCTLGGSGVAAGAPQPLGSV